MGIPRLQPLTSRWTRGGRSVVTALILANVIAFLGETILGLASPHAVEQWFALSLDGLRQGYVWQLVTYMFVHGDPAMPLSGVVHLFVNMMMLYFAGREVEAITGPKHLLGMYFLGGILGGLAQVLVFPESWAVGASAGVCAVLIAFTTILPEIEVMLLLFFIIPIRMRAKQLAWLIVGSSVVFASMAFLPLTGYLADLAHVAHIAHLGGCLVGWVYAKQLGFGSPWRLQRYLAERRRREERLARMPSAQFMQEEIDPILDKISLHGLRSLSRAERKILERGGKKIVEEEAVKPER